MTRRAGEPDGSDGDEIVTFLLDTDGAFDRLDAVHVDDGSGYCKTCGGPQSGRHRMPCTIRLALDRAAGFLNRG